MILGGAPQVLAIIIAIICVLWVGGKLDQWVQRRRGIAPDKYGHVPDGMVAKVMIAIIISCVGGYMILHGKDVEPTYRGE